MQASQPALLLFAVSAIAACATGLGADEQAAPQVFDVPVADAGGGGVTTNGATRSGAPSGTAAGTTAGSPDATASGGTAGTTVGSTAGSASGTTAGSTAGASSGSTGGTPPGTTAGSTAGTTAGSTAGTTDGGVASPTTCLLISEYLEGASNDKALEIWNHCATAVSVASVRICLESNAGATCTRDSALTGSIAAGQVLVVCNAGFSSSACDTTATAVDFNGNDRVALYLDTNGNGVIDRASDQLVEAFGRLGQPPPSGVVGGGANPWADVDLRRKACARFLSTGDFDAALTYSTAPYTSTSHLGVAPSLSCP